MNPRSAILRTRPLLLAAGLALAASLAGCATGSGGTAPAAAGATPAQYGSLLNAAESLYLRQDFQGAMEAFRQAAQAVLGRDAALYQAAMLRAGESSCMANYQLALAELRAGQRAAANQRLDAFLGNDACRRLTGESIHARQLRDGVTLAPADRP
ncbi:hypothetical protein [Ramlibacter sp.]|uniref:hypothetical protein n=1 Tax=Ramlibacter sp. TaxID=1917967 RepID=UPI002FC7BCEA